MKSKSNLNKWIMNCSVIGLSSITGITTIKLMQSLNENQINNNKDAKIISSNDIVNYNNELIYNNQTNKVFIKLKKEEFNKKLESFVNSIAPAGTKIDDIKKELDLCEKNKNFLFDKFHSTFLLNDKEIIDYKQWNNIIDKWDFSVYPLDNNQSSKSDIHIEKNDFKIDTSITLSEGYIFSDVNNNQISFSIVVEHTIVSDPTLELEIDDKNLSKVWLRSEKGAVSMLLITIALSLIAVISIISIKIKVNKNRV